jgi:phage head maturation protease
MTAQQSEPIPILRSFESDGIKYIAGYAAIFDSEDSYGTAMTREAVESSRDRLKSFPAVRFMHRIPFGQIDFDNTVEFEGKTYKTFVDNHGFHVLCRVYDQCVNEWNMVKSGKWGFSYGFQPDEHDGIQTRKLANGHTCPAFVKGIIYEVSVVDTPAHSDAVAYAVSRMIHGDTEEKITNEEPPRREGFIAQLEASRGILNTSTSERTASEPETPTSVFRSMIEEARGRKEETPTPTQKTAIMTGLLRQVDESLFPDKCNPELCPKDFARWCRANTEKHFGEPCIYKTSRNK